MRRSTSMEAPSWEVSANTRCQLLCRRDASYASSAKGWKKTEWNEDESCRNKLILWVRIRLVRENCSNQPGCCLKKKTWYRTSRQRNIYSVCLSLLLLLLFSIIWRKIIIQLYFGFSKDLSQSLTLSSLSATENPIGFSSLTDCTS